jgi:hypothetical protein
MLGGICWFCHWGWPKPIRDIYDRAEKEIDDILDRLDRYRGMAAFGKWEGTPPTGESALEYGPAHCTWSDENFDSVDWEIGHCSDPEFSDWHPDVLAIVKRSLEELKALPEELKVSPKGYDGEHPENYPPTHGVEMVK